MSVTPVSSRRANVVSLFWSDVSGVGLAQLETASAINRALVIETFLNWLDCMVETDIIDLERQRKRW